MSILNEKIAKFLLQSKAGQQFLGKFADSRLQMIPSWRAGQPVWSPWSTEKAIQEGLKMNVWVYACCRKIAQTASSIPWFVEQKKADGTWEAVPGHPIEILLKEPNNTMSGQDLFERLTYHLYLGGNGLWHMPLFKGVPVELWPVNPDKIKPVPSKQAGMIDYYEFKPSGGMQPVKIPTEEITHFMFVDPSDIYWGLAPLQAAARTVDTDNEADQADRSASRGQDLEI